MIEFFNASELDYAGIYFSDIFDEFLFDHCIKMYGKMFFDPVSNFLFTVDGIKLIPVEIMRKA